MLTSTLLSAQEPGISGTVLLKEDKAVLYPVTVVIRENQRSALTDFNGNFNIGGLKPGNYTLRFLFSGYTVPDIDLVYEGGVLALGEIYMELDRFEFDEVVVSASRKKEKIIDAPITIYSINSDKLDELSTFNENELVARLEGIDYSRTGLIQTRFNARGFNSAYNVKFLEMNDFRYSMQITTGAPFAALNTVVKEDIDRIEVIQGPASVFYGPNAHNGLIHRITKDPRYSEGLTAVVGGGLGVDDSHFYSTRIRHAKQVNDIFAYKLAMAYTNGKEYDYTDSVYFQGIAYPEKNLDLDFNSLRGEMAFYITPKPRHDIIVTYGGSKNDNVELTSSGRNQNIDWSINNLQLRYNSPHWFAQVYHTWSHTDSSITNNQYSQNYYSFVNLGFDEAEAATRAVLEQASINSMTGDTVFSNRSSLFRVESRRWFAEGQYSNSFAGIAFTGGVQWQRDLPNSLNTILLEADGAIVQDQIGAYVHFDRNLGIRSLKAVVAARLDYHDEYGLNFVPKAALIWMPKNGSLRFSYGRGIAAPTVLNLHAQIFGGILLGNAQGFTLSNGVKIEPLQVEEVNNFEVGYKGKLANKLYGDINTYFNISTNFISPSINIANPAMGIFVTERGDQPIAEVYPNPTPAGAPFLLTYINFGKVYTYGFDIGLTYELNKFIDLTAQYSYFDFFLDEEDITNDGNLDGKVTKNDLPINTPNHKFGAGINMGQGKWFANIFGRWVASYDFFSGKYVDAETDESITIAGDPLIEGNRVGRSFNAGPLGGFFNLDLSAGYKFWDERIMISAQLNNILNDEVREMAGSPSIGRFFSMQLRVDLPY